MANSKKTKKDNKEDQEKGSEPDSAVFWLKKIYEKMENMEAYMVENNSLIKQNSEKLDGICEEMKEIKVQCNKGSETGNQRTTNPQQQTKVTTSLTLPMRNTLTSRKLAYYNKIRSEGIATIYKRFLEQKPPFIPNKFRESSNDNESERHRERMKKLEIQKITFEIEHLEEIGEKHRDTLENSELEMKQHIGEQEDPIQRQALKEQWYALIKSEEEKSEAIWEKKKEFFESLPTRIENDQPRGIYQKTTGYSDYNTRKGNGGNLYYNARAPTTSGNHHSNVPSAMQIPFNPMTGHEKNRRYNERNNNNQNFHQRYFLRRNR